ncbi:MAG: hypothetical protein AB1540_09090 [Bdellovibrionota bacterium]
MRSRLFFSAVLLMTAQTAFPSEAALEANALSAEIKSTHGVDAACHDSSFESHLDPGPVECLYTLRFVNAFLDQNSADALPPEFPEQVSVVNTVRRETLPPQTISPALLTSDSYYHFNPTTLKIPSNVESVEEIRQLFEAYGIAVELKKKLRSTISCYSPNVLNCYRGMKALLEVSEVIKKELSQRHDNSIFLREETQDGDDNYLSYNLSALEMIDYFAFKKVRKKIASSDLTILCDHKKVSSTSCAILAAEMLKYISSTNFRAQSHKFAVISRRSDPESKNWERHKNQIVFGIEEPAEAIIERLSRL